MLGLLITLLLLVVAPIALAVGWPHRHHLLYRLRWQTYRRMLWDEMSELLGREERP